MIWHLQLATLSRRKYFAGVMVSREGQLLLGMKKRGFGRYCLVFWGLVDVSWQCQTGVTCRGLWQHSFCGKLEKGESIAEAAVRELEEESGLQVMSTNRERLKTRVTENLRDGGGGDTLFFRTTFSVNFFMLSSGTASRSEASGLLWIRIRWEIALPGDSLCCEEYLELKRWLNHFNLGDYVCSHFLLCCLEGPT